MLFWLVWYFSSVHSISRWVLPFLRLLHVVLIHPGSDEAGCGCNLLRSSFVRKRGISVAYFNDFEMVRGSKKIVFLIEYSDTITQ